MQVNLIAAIGKRGQIGLNQTLPWFNAEDLAFFKEATRGGILLFGQRTYDGLRDRDFPGRLRCNYARHHQPQSLLKEIARRYPGWPIWIAGGEQTYRDFAPFVDGLKILSVVDYDGPADTWFPFDAYGMEPRQ